MKVCSFCFKNKENSLFRKGRKQCIDCYNQNRNNSFRAKSAIEKSIYKNDWYLANKERLSLKSQESYIKNREYRLKRAKENYKKDFVKSLIRSSKARAKKISIEYSIDENFIRELYEKQDHKCSLLKISFEFDDVKNFKRRPFAPSIDRIDSNKGYTKDNVRLVCAIVNIAINEFGDENFDKMCRLYVENSLRRI